MPKKAPTFSVCQPQAFINMAPYKNARPELPLTDTTWNRIISSKSSASLPQKGLM